MSKNAIIVSMAGLKGGIGKTLIGYNFISYLARQGKKCLIIDTDYQGNMSSNFAQRITPKQMHECSLIRAFKQYSKDPGASFNFEPAHVGYNTDLISSDPHLDDVDNIMAKKPNLAPYIIMNLLISKHLIQKYDWILIDCHNNFKTLTKNALIVSDAIICPVVESRYSIESITGIIDRLKDLKTDFYDVKTGHSDINAKLYFVANMISNNNSIARAFTQAVSGNVNFTAKFHDRAVFKKAIANRNYNNIYSFLDHEKYNYNDLKIVNDEITPEFKKLQNIIKSDTKKRSK